MECFRKFLQKSTKSEGGSPEDTSKGEAKYRPFARKESIPTRLTRILRQVRLLRDEVSTDIFDEAQLPTSLKHLLAATLVVKFEAAHGAVSRNDTALRHLDANIFKGKLRSLLEKYSLSGAWEKALLDTVLVADRQVTYFVQVSGPPLHARKSTFGWIHTGLRKENFRENHTEALALEYDRKRVVAHRKKLSPKVASGDLRELRDRLACGDEMVLEDVFDRWAATTTVDRKQEVFKTILEKGHPFRRTLENFLNSKKNSSMLSCLFLECSHGVTSLIVANLSAILIDKCILKNLLFDATRSRLKAFLCDYMRHRIDYGSIDLLESKLRRVDTTRWMRKLGLPNAELFLRCLCAFLAKLAVLNIHAVFEVGSRCSSPKIPEYALEEEVSAKRRTCLGNLIRENLEPSTSAAQGTMLALPKSSPFEYRPVHKYLSRKPKLSLALKSCIQCLKSDCQSRLRVPICAMSSALALQRLAKLREQGRLFFVKGDVRDCYGSIDLDGLKDWLSGNWPTATKALEFLELDLPIRPGSRKKRFLHLFEDRIFRRPLCDGRLSVLIPTGNQSCWEPRKELGILLKWMENIVVKIDGTSFRFHKGIPQGAILSSMIADLYLAIHVDQLFERFRDDLAVFRTMDDYLAVSTSLDTAQRCLQIFKNESLHRGLTFSESKYSTNWSVGVDDSDKTLPWSITYCGEEVDPISGCFKFSPEYKTFVDNVRTYRKDLHGLPMQRAFKYLLTSSYWGFSGGLFSYDGRNLPLILRNVYEAAIDSAMRFRSYVDDTHIAISNLERFIRLHRLVFTRYVKTAVFKNSPESLKLPKRSIAYLHFKAFRTIMAQNKRRYDGVLRAIEASFENECKTKNPRHKELLVRASRSI
ncbi:uncharacterized protein LOC100903713 [Galendromus occidentalis]|uniref:Telomerase reverse transcriptase n=1 Tax=Galendromus occidentalis TaxID=34638 RepID=A0AAJ7WIC0_9ACAR|nr:uncharacterized protein LOC100903713 [Galendromus occidentalis]